MATLGARIADRDARTFVGRRRQLALFDSTLAGVEPANILFIHGVGGIGKSTLLRELARRAGGAGRPVLSIDGRQLPADPAAVARVLRQLETGLAPVVIVDNWDQISSLGDWLRREALPGLPADIVFVLAGREPPEAAWTRDGWERVTAEIELQPLSSDEAEALLRALGVRDDKRIRRLARWAGGWPLGLALATELPDEEQGEPGDELLARLSRKLMDEEVTGAAAGVLAVATIARTTTPELLGVVLPDQDPTASFAWLAGRSFSEPLGRGLTIHELLRRLLREQLRRKSPELELDLRRRIIDHLHDLGQREGLSVMLELIQLIENQQIRWGLGESRGNYWISDVHPGDEAAVGAALISHPDERHLVAPFLAHDPSHVFVVRGREPGISGIAVSVTPVTAGSVATTDPVLGPWLRHARSLSPEGNAVLWQTAAALVDDPVGEVQSLLGSGGLLRSGLRNPRYIFLPINPRHPDAVAFAQAIGAKHVPELDVTVGTLQLQCHVADLGPGGALGAVRDVVYLEMGLSPRAPLSVPVEAVREALRDLHDPVRLASGSLASLIEPALTAKRVERAARVTECLRSATDTAFGESHEERVRRDIIEQTFWALNGNHTATAQALHLSRATYFRRLGEATERLAVWLSDHRGITA